MSSNGGKGGAQTYDPKYGANQALNKQLAQQYGYKGDFGSGGFNEFMSQQSDPMKRAVQGSINSFVDPNSLMGQVGKMYGQANRATNKAMNFTPEQLANIDRTPYMNPYTQDVIDQTMGEMNRQYGLQQTGLGDQAIGAGAFGGDRHGLAQAEMARNQMDQSQNWLAMMNDANFQQATGQAQFDIGGQHQNKAANLQGAGQLGNLANMGFGMASGIQGMQRQAGMDQFNMNQALMDRQQQQWGGYSGQPYQNLQAWNQGMPNMSGMGQTTQSSNPGLMGVLGGGLQIASMFCWVAREVYGADDPKWVQFRSWMLDGAPKWLRNLYGRHGERIARTVKRRPWLKKILRPIMDLAI